MAVSYTHLDVYKRQGITIQYEMCYTNILQILDLSQIAMLSSERKEEDVYKRQVLKRALEDWGIMITGPIR